MDTYALIKEWKKRTRPDPIRESRKIRRQFLNEISYGNYERIKDWMSSADEFSNSRQRRNQNGHPRTPHVV